MKPSFSTTNSKSQIEREVSTKIINCPNGTVPILKPIKEYAPNVSYSAENHVNPFSDGTRGTHVSNQLYFHYSNSTILSLLKILEFKVFFFFEI